MAGPQASAERFGFQCCCHLQSVCSALKNKLEAQWKGQLGRRAGLTSTSSSSAPRGVQLCPLGPGCHSSDKEHPHRRHVPIEAPSACPPGAVLPDHTLLALTDVTGTMEHTDSNSSLRRGGRARPLPGAHSSPHEMSVKGLPSTRRTLTVLLLSLPTLSQPCHPWTAGFDSLCSHVMLSPPCPCVPRAGLFWGKGNRAPPQPGAWPSRWGGTAGFPGGTHEETKEKKPRNTDKKRKL